MEDYHEVYYDCSLNRIEDHIFIEDTQRKRKKKNLNFDDEENLKMGEIAILKNKYYYIPNSKDNMNELTGEELFSWLIFKGTKFPINKSRYRIKEGDIIKMGRLWLIIRAIHIPIKRQKEKRLDIKDTDCIMVSHHNQGNQSLNVKDDFKDDIKVNPNYLESSDDDSSDSEKKEKNKNKIINLIDDDKEKDKNNKDNKEKDKEKKDKKKNDAQRICRICYLEEDNPTLNPLIRPCKCSGSMKYIHLKCLIVWIKTKVEIDNSEYLDNGKYTIYSSEKIECELCKEVFPEYIKHNNKLYNLMDFEQYFGEDDDNNNNIIITEGEVDKKDKAKTGNSNSISSNLKKKKTNDDKSQDKINNKRDPYIVIDSISLEKNQPSYRYIAKFCNNVLKIGRGIDMDLIMNDLSISRNHCHLELTDNGEVLLKDMNSKFGTLILVQAKKMEILENQTLTIQVGRTFFNIGYKKNNSLFSCCQAEEVDLTQSYEKINYKAVKFRKHCNILTEVDNEDEEEEVQIEPVNKEKENENEKESEYEVVIKDINNKKKISERMKTNEDKKEGDLIDASRVEIEEKNNTFQKEKLESDF